MEGFPTTAVFSQIIEWAFGERIFDDHIYVQALGSDGRSMDDNKLNITSVEIGDGSGS